MTVFVYEFEDGNIYKLIGVGLSANDIWKLEEIHGKLKEKRSEQT